MNKKNPSNNTNIQRCEWANSSNALTISYHDNEWGRPVYEDNKLFEMLVLEMFQSGLSWECVLNKREAFRLAYDNFDVNKVALYDHEKINELCNNAGIIRNKKKITSSINNAKIFIEIQNKYNSFSNYIWKWTDNKVIRETNMVSSPLSDTISKDLKSRGMVFIGTTTIYSYLQAIGVINAHDENCFLSYKNNDQI